MRCGVVCARCDVKNATISILFLHDGRSFITMGKNVHHDRMCREFATFDFLAAHFCVHYSPPSAHAFQFIRPNCISAIVAYSGEKLHTREIFSL